MSAPILQRALNAARAAPRATARVCPVRAPRPTVSPARCAAELANRTRCADHPLRSPPTSRARARLEARWCVHLQRQNAPLSATLSNGKIKREASTELRKQNDVFYVPQ